MRKRLIVVISISVIAITLMAGFFLLLRNKPKADSLTMSNIQSSTGLVIKVSSKYNYDQIKSALSIANGTSTRLATATDKAIISEIRTKMQSAATQFDQQMANADFPYDAVIQIADSSGKIIILSSLNQPITRSATTNPADNFNFDPLVQQWIKDIIIATYPKIEQLNGPRYSTGKISVKIVDGGAPRFSFEFNEIMLPKKYNVNIESYAYGMTGAKEMFTHELAHAFQNPQLPWLPYKEGFAAAQSFIINKDEIIANPFDGGSQYINQGSALGQSAANLPSMFNLRDNLYLSYLVGGSTFYNLYLQDHDFFKKFNAAFLSNTAVSDQDWYIQHQIMDSGGGLATDVSRATNAIVAAEPTIEGMPAIDWLARKPFLFSLLGMSNGGFYADGGGGMMISVLGNLSINTDSPGEGYPLYSPLTEVNLYNSKNTKVVSYTNFPEKNALSEAQPSYKDPSFDSYTGLLRVEVMKNGQLEDKKNQYICKYLDSNANVFKGIVGTVIGEGMSAKISLLDSNGNTLQSSSVPITNGCFFARDSFFVQEGRFKTEILNSSGQSLGSDSFYKSAFSYFNTQIFTENTDNCQPKVSIKRVPSAIAGKDTVTITAVNNSYCSDILVFDSKPVARIWNKTLSFKLDNIDRLKSYDYQIYSFDNLGPVKKYSSKSISYDFNCNGVIDNNDTNVIANFWRNGTTITNTLVSEKTKTCKNLGDYLSILLSKGSTQVLINEVTRLGYEIKSRIYTSF